MRLLAALLATAALAGCGSFDPFGPDRPTPKPLEPIAAPITAAQVWKESIGKVEFPMVVAVNGGVVTMASSDGNVVALEAASGRSLWRANVGPSSLRASAATNVAAVVPRGAT